MAFNITESFKAMFSPDEIAGFIRDYAFTYWVATPELLEKRRLQAATITIEGERDNKTVTINEGYNKEREWLDAGTYDIVKINFWDEKGFMGDSGHRYFVFDVDATTRIRIFAVLDAARSPGGPDAVANLQATDAAMRSATGISALETPVLRELLMNAAYRVMNNELISFIAGCGSPSTEQATGMLRSWFNEGWDTGCRGPTFPRSVDAALIRGGWCSPDTLAWEVDLLARCPNCEGDEDGARALFDAHVESGLLQEQEHRARALVLFTGGESAEMMEYALGKVPLSDVSKEQLSEALGAAVGRGPARVKRVLDLGADPNMAHHPGASTLRPSWWRYSGRELPPPVTPLQIAVESGDEETVRLLLEHNATMKPNEQGETPLVLPEKEVKSELE